MMTEMFVFDTYALYRIVEGGKSYDSYRNAKMVVNDFILAELCFKLIRDLGKEQAYRYIDWCASFSVRPDKETIKEAMSFRHQHKQRSLSITDCISYAMAKRHGIKFLTGDDGFKGLENVEFVK